MLEEYNLNKSMLDDDDLKNFENTDIEEKLENYKKIWDSLLDKVDSIKKEIYLNERKLEIKKTFLEKSIDSITIEKDNIKKDISIQKEKSKEIKEALTPSFEEYQLKEKYYLYLVLLQHIGEISSNIKSALVIKANEEALKFLWELFILWTRIKEGRTKCSNLLEYLTNIVKFWFGIIFQKFSANFEEVASQFGWPFISSESMSHNKSMGLSKDGKIDMMEFGKNNHNLVQQLKNSVRLIFRLPEQRGLFCGGGEKDGKVTTGADVAGPNSNKTSDTFNLAGAENVSLLTHVLLSPFYKRFKYHFTGNRKTNQLNKPEWYFSQLLEWIKLNSPFLYTVLPPILENLGHHLDIQADFVKGMIYVAKEKLSNDLRLLPPDDEDTFTHVIDETVVFHRGLGLYGYDLSIPSCVELFCEDKYFTRWITAEHRSATEKVNDFLMSPNAWVCDYVDKPGSKEKVPEFVEKYVILLEYLSDRYNFIPFPLKKIQFLTLQIELLDDFRIRLLQILRETKLDQSTYTEIKANLESYCYILNSFDFIIKTLNKWKDLPTFVHIGYIKDKYSKFVAHKRRLQSSQTASATNAPIEPPGLANSTIMGSFDDASSKSEQTLENFLESLTTALENLEETGPSLLTLGVNDNGKGEGERSENAYHFTEEENEFYDKVLNDFSSGGTTTIPNVTQKFPLSLGPNDEGSGLVDGGEDETTPDLNVFADTVELYWMARADTLNHLIDCARALCHLKLKPYSKQRWNTFPPKSYFINAELSPMACDVLAFMKELLFMLKKYLTPDIFKKFMVKLIKDLDDFVYEEIVSKNYFNDGGAHQLYYDINKGFLSVFSLHTTIPENLFKKTCDAASLLNLNRGTALLLEESITDGSVAENSSIASDLVVFKRQREALRDIGVKLLDVDQVLKVLSHRKYGGGGQ